MTPRGETIVGPTFCAFVEILGRSLSCRRKGFFFSSAPVACSGCVRWACAGVLMCARVCVYNCQKSKAKKSGKK